MNKEQLSLQTTKNLKSVEMSNKSLLTACVKDDRLRSRESAGWEGETLASTCWTPKPKPAPTKSHHCAHYPSPPLSSWVEFEERISTKLHEEIWPCFSLSLLGSQMRWGQNLRLWRPNETHLKFQPAQETRQEDSSSHSAYSTQQATIPK